MSMQIHVGDYITDGSATFKVKRIGHTRLNIINEEGGNE